MGLSVDILDSAEYLFYHPGDTTRTGIEIEFKKIGHRRAAEVVASQLGGTIVEMQITEKTTIKKVLPDGTKIYNEVTKPEYVVRGSRLGDIVLKIDLNQVSDVGTIDPEHAVIELVTPPIQMPEVIELERALQALKNTGAVGTDARTPVATQVNVEIAGGIKERVNAQEIVDLLRSYMRPSHRKQIDQHMQIPEIRKQYAEPYSDGFIKKLLDPSYRPTIRELYDDAIYRQSLEMLGEKKAWTLSIEEARRLLLKHPNPIVPKVVKLNPVRISSLLMWMEPDDPMTRIYHSSGWAVPRPLIEFRQWNTDFKIISPTRQAMGFVSAARDYGYYDHDRLIYALSGVDEETLAKLRKNFYGKKNPGMSAVEWERQQQKKKTLFRYFLGDPKTIDKSEYDNLLPHYRKTQVGFLPSGNHGKKPVPVPGTSVVAHRRPFHRHNIMGKYNPGLVNYSIQQALENKVVEAFFFEEYSPGVMPETETFLRMRQKKQLPEFSQSFSKEQKFVYAKKIEENLNRRFPRGWVMKTAWDLGSEKDIITHKSSIAVEYRKFLESDFIQFRDLLIAKYPSLLDAAPEYLQAELKKHPAYKGYRISLMLENSDNTLVQKMVDIGREFRVEIMGGRVLGQGSTIDRYAYLHKYSKKKGPYVPPTTEQVAQVEAFAQSIVDRLPPSLRGMPMGMDIALLKDGSVTMIESNPGGNSNFLFEEERESVLAHEKFLSEYPEWAQQRKVHPGMNGEDQMRYLKNRFERWGIPTETMYPGMRFEVDRIIDVDYPALEVSSSYYLIRTQPASSRSEGSCASGGLSRVVESLMKPIPGKR